ncbi:unnamed protein product [Vitrella brassicaformis CCMP3155]|uniref:Uncharacterized protein n=1 Tax=Vitrella brassicaformis (strain CCMP3155) TaxID=1169540 RepID=A0A0G4EE77_VITBC|nr:unnamed protein product [Vitrella brassicaformis CCMP3155]|eukprot:CEL94282.1 unnamed protein product [Vitrella brassicaformis CCMP3155]
MYISSTARELTREPWPDTFMSYHCSSSASRERRGHGKKQNASTPCEPEKWSPAPYKNENTSRINIDQHRVTRWTPSPADPMPVISEGQLIHNL